MYSVQESDLVVTGFTPTYERSKVVDFTMFFAEDPMAAMIPPPHFDDIKINAIVQPFAVEVPLLNKLLLHNTGGNETHVLFFILNTFE